jgi:ribokinase
MPTPRILVVGSSNTDMIVKLDHIPRPGETVIGGEFATAAGGKGANQAVAAARAGAQVTFLACLGQDQFGEAALAGFQSEGIETRYIKQVKGAASGVALICVSKHGQNSIAVASGANNRLLPVDVRNSRKPFDSASVVVMQLETPLPTVLAAAKLAKASGAKVILNPAPARPLPPELLKLISILTPNELEAETLSGVQVRDAISARRAAERLQRAGPEFVVITMGPRGAFVLDGTAGQLMRAPKVKAVDTTAAGDVFNGALAVAIAEGQPLLSAVRFAIAAAAISVTRLGAQPSAPFRPEIERAFKSSR